VKIALLLLSVLVGSCYWLWATQPAGQASLSDEELKRSLNEGIDSPGSLRSALTRITETKEEAPGQPVPAALARPDPAAPAPMAMGGSSGALEEIASTQDPARKLAAIQAQLSSLEPSQFPARMELVTQLFAVQGQHGEAASLALDELSSGNDGIRDAPHDWKRVYVDHLMKAYLTHAATAEGMATLGQRVESEPDPVFRQLLQERYAINRIPDLERQPAAQAAENLSQ
jgi:hypothetical protein